LRTQSRPKPRPARGVTKRPKPGSTLRKLADQVEALQQDAGGTSEFDDGRAAAIADAVERVGAVIQRGLEELATLDDDTSRQAAAYLRHMEERSDTLEAQIESYARDCAEFEQQFRSAGKRVFEPLKDDTF
jgi:hypothetical protein